MIYPPSTPIPPLYDPIKTKEAVYIILGTKPGIYSLSSLPQGGQPRLKLFEAQRGTTHVIAGWHGQRLSPLRLKTKAPRGIHAQFNTWERATIITVTPTDNDVAIRVNRVSIETRNGLEVKNERFWSGDSRLSGLAQMYHDAVRAALEKARCEDCHEAHYSIPTYGERFIFCKICCMFGHHAEKCAECYFCGVGHRTIDCGQPESQGLYELLGMQS